MAMVEGRVLVELLPASSPATIAMAATAAVAATGETHFLLVA